MATPSERLTAAALGGLPTDETLALRGDPASAKLIDEWQQFDTSVTECFESVWAAAEHAEDRALASFRSVQTPRRWLSGWQRKFAYGLAASIGLGLTGMVVSQFGLPLPGNPFTMVKDAAPTAVANRGNGTELFSVDASIENGSDKNDREQLAQRNTSNEGGRSVIKAIDSTVTGDVADKNYVDRFSASPQGGAMAVVDDAKNKLDEKAIQAQTHRNWALSDDTRKALEDKVRFGKDVVPTSPETALRSYYANVSELDKSGTVKFGEGKEQYGLPGITNQNLSFKFDPQGAAPAKPAAPAPKQVPPPTTTGLTVESPPAPAVVTKKIIIRTGDMEFEVESFDGSVAAVSKLVAAIPGAFIGTINSDKMANGKVKGSIVCRVPPEALDTLVLDLRKELGRGGELKGQRIGSQDITKQYTDLESRLRAARTMETRLLEIIKSGKGEIKQLLEAEKELGVWRTKIEEIEGELRYYGNQVSLSTLTITLAEKEIRTAATITESERISSGMEVEDVEAAYRAVQKLVTDAKGRILKAELKQLARSQFTATLVFQVAPDAAGPLQDRLKQTGTLARMSIERQQSSDGQPVPVGTKVVRGDTTFDLQIYNIAAIAPRESVITDIAVADTGKAMSALRDVLARTKARVLTSNFVEADPRSMQGRIDFDVNRADLAAVQAQLDSLGTLIARNVSKGDEAQTTDAKVKYVVTFTNFEKLAARETQSLAVEVSDVNAAVAQITQAATKASGKIIDRAQSRTEAGRDNARLIVEVPLSSLGTITESARGAGVIRSTTSSQNPSAPDGAIAKARVELRITNEERIVAADDGVGPQIRKGLSQSAGVLLASVSWVVIGLCVVLPWLLIGWLVLSLGRWFAKSKKEKGGQV